MLTNLLNGIIKAALQNRMLVAAVATCLLLYGGWPAGGPCPEYVHII
jgi:hypothetical protein